MQSRYTFSSPQLFLPKASDTLQDVSIRVKHPSPKKTNKRPGNICFIFERYHAIFSNEINFCNKGNRKQLSKGDRKVKLI